MTHICYRGHNPNNSSAASWWFVRDSQMAQAPSACRRRQCGSSTGDHVATTKCDRNVPLCRHRDSLLDRRNASLDFRVRHNDLWGVWCRGRICILRYGRFRGPLAGLLPALRACPAGSAGGSADGPGRFLPMHVAAVPQFEFPRAPSGTG